MLVQTSPWSLCHCQPSVVEPECPLNHSRKVWPLLLEHRRGRHLVARFVGRHTLQNLTWANISYKVFPLDLASYPGQRNVILEPIGNSSVFVRFLGLRGQFLSKRKLTIEWSKCGLCPFLLSFLFPKTPNEMGKGFSFDVFQEQRWSFLKEKNNDWWMVKIWAMFFSFLDFGFLKNVKWNRCWLMNCLQVFI